MKTIEVSKQSKALNALLRKARRENIILRSAQGEEFILAEVDDFYSEIEMTRDNNKLMKLLETRARQKATVSLQEAKKLLGIEN